MIDKDLLTELWADIYHDYVNYLYKVYMNLTEYSQDCSCPECLELRRRLITILENIWHVVHGAVDDATKAKLDIAKSFFLDRSTKNDLIAIAVILGRKETSVEARQELAEAVARHFTKRLGIYAGKGVTWFQPEGEQ